MHPTVQIEAQETTPLLGADQDVLKGKQAAFVYLAAATGAIGGFLFGYDTGIISGALIFIRDVFDLNEWWQEVIVSSTLLGAWMFSILSGPANERFGRKPVIVASSLIFVLGSVLMALAWNEIILLIGRLVVGAGVGFASMTVPMYIAEVAPSSIRGQLVMLNICCVTGGQFFASVIAYWFSFMDHNTGWRYMLAFAAIPAGLQFFALLIMPESPRWLVQKSRYDDARQVLVRIRPKGANIETEFEAIRANCNEAREERNREKEESTDGTELSTFRRILATQPVRKALIVGCLLQVTAQLSGINSVMYYSASIFEMSGVHSKPKALLLAAGTALVNFVFTLVGYFLVERAGRRKLTLTSLACVVLSLLVLAAGFQFASVNSPEATYIDPAPKNYPCNQITACSACARNSNCGFCFVEDPTTSGAVIEAACLHADPKHHDRSLTGGCAPASPNNATLNRLIKPEQEHIWAYEWCPSAYSWITLLGMVMYLMAFAPGMGPMPWTINSEIYPSWARSWCQSAQASVCWLFNLLVSVTFLSLTRAITKHGAFYLYSLFASLGLIYFVIVLPETRSKSLEELEGLFASKEWREKMTRRAGARRRSSNKEPQVE